MQTLFDIIEHKKDQTVKPAKGGSENKVKASKEEDDTKTFWPEYNWQQSEMQPFVRLNMSQEEVNAAGRNQSVKTPD